MKRQITPLKKIFTLLFVVSFVHLYAQYNTGNNINNIRSSINPVKDKISQINIYAEQAYNAGTAEEAKKAGTQILLLTEEVKNFTQNAESSLNLFSTPENMEKYGKYLNSIASDLVDLQNKMGAITRNAHTIIDSNERDLVRRSVNKITVETKKMETILSENKIHLDQTDQKLASND